MGETAAAAYEGDRALKRGAGRQDARGDPAEWWNIFGEAQKKAIAVLLKPRTHGKCHHTARLWWRVAVVFPTETGPCSHQDARRT